MSNPIISLTYTGLPDYYSGSSKVPVAICQCQARYTGAELASEIDSEMNSIYEMMQACYTKEELDVWDQYVESLKARGDEVVYDDPHFVEPNDGDDCGVLIFELCRPTTFAGLTF